MNDLGYLNSVREGFMRGHHSTITVGDCREEKCIIFYKGQKSLNNNDELKTT
jgi:hypothetical protein